MSKITFWFQHHLKLTRLLLCFLAQRSRSGSKSPGRNTGDRFIPSLNKKQALSGADFLNVSGGVQSDGYQQTVLNAMNGTDKKPNILSFANKPKTAFGGSHASKVIFSASKSRTKVSVKNIGNNPEILKSNSYFNSKDFFLGDSWSENNK